MSKSKQERRLKMALRTVTGTAREGFFIPYRHAAGVPERLEPYVELLPLFENACPQIKSVLANIDEFAEDLVAIDGSGEERARWDQYWYPRMDAAAAYALVRTHQPRHIIEVGSGHSSRFMVRAQLDAGFSSTFTAIDPEPRADISALPLSLKCKTLQDVDLALFAQLRAGDFVLAATEKQRDIAVHYRLIGSIIGRLADHLD